MDWLTPSSLLYWSIIIYLTAAIVAIFFYRHPHLCTLFAQSGCIFASALGAASALKMILFDQEKLIITPFESTVPFISISMTLDALSAFFILILSILVCCVSLYSIGYLKHYYNKRNVSAFHALYIGFILSMIFVFTAGNAVFFFIAWEIMTVISYFLVVFESEDVNEKAGLIYIVMTHIGAAFLMIAFMIMFVYTKSFDIFGTPMLILQRQAMYPR